MDQYKTLINWKIFTFFDSGICCFNIGRATVFQDIYGTWEIMERILSDEKWLNYTQINYSRNGFFYIEFSRPSRIREKHEMIEKPHEKPR